MGKLNNGGRRTIWGFDVFMVSEKLPQNVDASAQAADPRMCRIDFAQHGFQPVELFFVCPN